MVNSPYRLPVQTPVQPRGPFGTNSRGRSGASFALGAIAEVQDGNVGYVPAPEWRRGYVTGVRTPGGAPNPLSGPRFFAGEDGAADRRNNAALLSHQTSTSTAPPQVQPWPTQVAHYAQIAMRTISPNVAIVALVAYYLASRRPKAKRTQSYMLAAAATGATWWYRYRLPLGPARSA